VRRPSRAASSALGRQTECAARALPRAVRRRVAPDFITGEELSRRSPRDQRPTSRSWPFSSAARRPHLFAGTPRHIGDFMRSSRRPGPGPAAGDPRQNAPTADRAGDQAAPGNERSSRSCCGPARSRTAHHRRRESSAVARRRLHQGRGARGRRGVVLVIVIMVGYSACPGRSPSPRSRCTACLRWRGWPVGLP